MTFLDMARKVESTYSGSYPPDILGPQTPADLTSLAPTSIVVNTPTLVTITGTGFTHASRVYADEAAQSTQYVSPTQLRYMAQADSVGAQDISVHNGSEVSDVLSLTVTAAVGAEGAQAQEQSTPPAEPEPEPAPEPPPEEPLA